VTAPRPSAGRRRAPRDAAHLETFSDGVFAIAATLLTLDVAVGTFPRGHLLSGLSHAWPQFLAYGLSFLLIGQIWASHHVMFRWIDDADHVLLLLDVALLGCIALQPVPTRLVADALRHGSHTDQAVAVALYSGLLFLGGLFYNAIWRYAAHADLLRPGLDRRRVRAQSRRYLLGPLVYLIAAGTAFLSVPVALVLDLLLIAAYLMPSADLTAADRNVP